MTNEAAARRAEELIQSCKGGQELFPWATDVLRFLASLKNEALAEIKEQEELRAEVKRLQEQQATKERDYRVRWSPEFVEWHDANKDKIEALARAFFMSTQFGNGQVVGGGPVPKEEAK